MWQGIYEELRDHGFVILAIALDTAGEAAAGAFARAGDAGALGPLAKRIMGWSDALWARAGRPTYPCLLDVQHGVAELYDITNVPMAVWIDEEGRIVRPPETAGAFDVVRHIDVTTFGIPDEVARQGEDARTRYVDAVRDWVRKGPRSRFALPPEEIARRSRGPGDAAARAQACFQLAAWLWRHGDADAARPYFEEAVRLRPESWTFRRQKLAVADAAAIGNFAAGPEYWEAVQALGDRPYYAPPDLGDDS